MTIFASSLRSISTCILAAAWLAAGPAFAVQVDVAFDAGGDAASWSQAPNWDPDVVPDNGVDSYAVSIDQNGAFDVQLDVNASIDSLSLGNDDTLTFGNGFDLSIVDGGLNNENLINLDSSGSLTILTLQNGAAITGGGTLDLSDNAGNRILSDGTSITHGAAHTISGAGQLLNNSGGILNQGTILADEATALSIDPGALGFDNQGTLRGVLHSGQEHWVGLTSAYGRSVNPLRGAATGPPALRLLARVRAAAQRERGMRHVYSTRTHAAFELSEARSP